MDRRQVLTEELAKASEGIQKLQEYMNEIQIRGRVSASTKVFPGVIVFIRDVKEVVHSEYRGVTFILENGLVRVSKYEEPEDVSKRGLDGFGAN